MGWDGLGGAMGLEVIVEDEDVKSGWVVIRVKLRLGDCVWCVLLPKPVANATNSSKTTPPVSHN